MTRVTCHEKRTCLVRPLGERVKPHQLPLQHAVTLHLPQDPLQPWVPVLEQLNHLFQIALTLCHVVGKVVRTQEDNVPNRARADGIRNDMRVWSGLEVEVRSTHEVSQFRSICQIVCMDHESVC